MAQDDQARVSNNPEETLSQYLWTHRYNVYSLILVAVVIGGFLWFAYHLREADQKLFAVVFFHGACGGALYAIRNSNLEWPKLEENTIHLGWVADCAYGVAGAFCVFLLVPGLSESARNGFIDLYVHEVSAEESSTEEADNETNDDKQEPILLPPPQAALDGATKLDLLEVIAVAVVGGFAGRSFLWAAVKSVGGHGDNTDPTPQPTRPSKKTASRRNGSATEQHIDEMSATAADDATE